METLIVKEGGGSRPVLASVETEDSVVGILRRSLSSCKRDPVGEY